MTYRTGFSTLSTGSLRVMIAERHVFTGMVLANMVEALGHEVVGYTARAHKALRFAETEWLDVAILAVELNDPAYPIADTLAARNIPFIFSAQYDHPPVLSASQIRPLLRRPFQQAEIGTMLDQVRHLRDFDDMDRRISA